MVHLPGSRPAADLGVMVGTTVGLTVGVAAATAVGVGKLAERVGASAVLGRGVTVATAGDEAAGMTVGAVAGPA